jgi:hypothetical protein
VMGRDRAAPGPFRFAGFLVGQSMLRRAPLSAALAVLLLPAAADAHSFIEPYTLPVPFRLYLYGCAAMLAATFAAFSYFAGVPVARRTPRGLTLDARSRAVGVAARSALALLRASALACLLLTVVAGLVGTPSPSANIGMALFWIGFLLAFAYLTALIGDIYQLVNPWRTMVAGAQALGLDLARQRLAYPRWLGYYPALILYVALIWIELFWLPKPATLSLVLIGYSLATLAGAWLFGTAVWFDHGEVFAVFFRLIGTLAPVAYAPRADGRSWQVRLRLPFTGTIDERPAHISLVLFVLFMLSSTTYDGVHETVLWVGLFWKNLLALLQPLWGADMAKAQASLAGLYTLYQRAGLLLSPLLYFAVYMLVMWATRAAVRTAMPLRALALHFAYSIIPIAFVYNVTHYYTLVLTELPLLPYIVSDPLGFGWNLLGLAPDFAGPAPLDMAVIWHSEVALILAGHVASVCLAHVAALRLLPTRRQAMISQLPMLLLMMAYTIMGLWVLSLPLALH